LPRIASVESRIDISSNPFTGATQPARYELQVNRQQLLCRDLWKLQMAVARAFNTPKKIKQEKYYATFPSGITSFILLALHILHLANVTV
jgi:hypothetical protein